MASLSVQEASGEYTVISAQENFCDELFHNCSTRYESIPITSIKFNKRHFNKGACSNIYLVCDDSGKEYALKLFNERLKIPQNSKEGRCIPYKDIIENAIANLDTLLLPPFTTPRIIPNANWYISDYHPGDSIENLLQNGKLDKKTKVRAIQAYMNMLSLIHERNICFGDNSWSAVIANEREIKICDWDSLTKLCNQNTELTWMKQGPYANNEQLHGSALKKTSDLESFARMIIAAYNNAPLQREEFEAKREHYTKQVLKQTSRQLYECVENLTSICRQVTTQELAEAIFKL